MPALPHHAAAGLASPSLASRIGVQGLLVALGALLVAVAGIVFLVFAWDRLSLGGRALVVGALTLAAMAGATWLRPRLPETAEGIGAIATVLVLGDAWAIRATGLFGTDGWNGVGYAAPAAAASRRSWSPGRLGRGARGLAGRGRAGAAVSRAGRELDRLAPAASWLSVAGLALVAAGALGAARVSDAGRRGGPSAGSCAGAAPGTGCSPCSPFRSGPSPVRASGRWYCSAQLRPPCCRSGPTRIRRSRCRPRAPRGPVRRHGSRWARSDAAPVAASGGRWVPGSRSPWPRSPQGSG